MNDKSTPEYAALQAAATAVKTARRDLVNAALKACEADTHGTNDSFDVAFDAQKDAAFRFVLAKQRESEAFVAYRRACYAKGGKPWVEQRPEDAP